MKLYIPVGKWFITQKYSENLSDYYVNNGAKSHGAFDVCAIGTDKGIYASCDGLIYSILDRPDPMQYSAIYQLVDDLGVFYELVYGHPNKIFVKPGDYVKKGQLIGEEGNRGYVFSGGKEVTLAEKQTGSRKGAHVHWQLRACKPVEKKTTGKKYLTNTSGVFKDGMIYEILNYDNGNKGCIDLEPFVVYETAKPKTIPDKIVEFITPYKLDNITSVLRYGSKGSQVKILQSLLKITVDGSFGIQTLTAVKTFQKNNGLLVDGVVGPLTLAKLKS